MCSASLKFMLAQPAECRSFRELRSRELSVFDSVMVDFALPRADRLLLGQPPRNLRSHCAVRLGDAF